MEERGRSHFQKRIVLLLALLALLVVATQAAAQDSPFDIPLLAPKWQSAPPGLRLSTGATQGADGPVVAITPDGSKVMVVYNRRVTGSTDRDPYFTVYDGQSWSSPAPVLISSGTDSAQVALSYDSNNVAHLIWEEPALGLAYLRNDGSGWSGFKIIAPTIDRLFGTSISTTGSQVLDVAWAAKANATQNPNIYHARSTNGGNSWSAPTPIAQTTPTSQAPEIAHDANGIAHVVWQESTAAPGFEIRYARGLPWSQPTTITPASLQNSRRPSLTIAGNTLHVAFTRLLAVDSENSDQWAYYTRCFNNCTVATSWSAPLNTSGQPVRVNESAPFDLIPEIASHEGCTYVFFHGYLQAVSPNEVIWDVNNCDGWSGGGRDQVTGFNMRGIYPKTVMHDDTIHLVYEWVSGNDHQIYYMNGTIPEGQGPGGDGDVYLPFLARP